ncbi:MAG TPA: galactokinase [Candidatus Melainabacteria bacterium]|nr:galactokinase [Candidatus Melainabacteria bacterium]
MIIARSPMRISLGGGGTDLPSYYENHGGFFISAAINQYVYVLINESWHDEYVLKYSQFERAKSIAEIKHPIIRSALEWFEMAPHLEIASIADIPQGTGLGSSGSFTTALLRALHAYRKSDWLSPVELAEQACNIEIELLREPVGKQDPYISALGGITCFEVGFDGKVVAFPARISADTLSQMEDNLAIFYTGITRAASDLLKDQNNRTNASENEMLDNLHHVKALGRQSKEALESGDMRQFAELMNEHWRHKRQRSKGMSNSHIDELYELAMRSGASGGKLVGAGGGGFLMFYTEEKNRLREAMQSVKANEMRFHFDFTGTTLIGDRT